MVSNTTPLSSDDSIDYFDGCSEHVMDFFLYGSKKLFTYKFGC